MRILRRKQQQQSKRRGVAAVEFAVCVPMFVLLTAGAIQTTDGIYLKTSLRVVAYETVREAVEVGSNNDKAIAKATEIFTARNVQGGAVTFSPSDITTAVPGQTITVTVTAPADSNTIMPQWFFSGQIIKSSMTMSRE